MIDEESLLQALRTENDSLRRQLAENEKRRVEWYARAAAVLPFLPSDTKAAPVQEAREAAALVARKALRYRELYEICDEVLVTLKHARTFITSREKMHPDGVKLYDELIRNLQRSIREK